jgi:hypothetical protein
LQWTDVAKREVGTGLEEAALMMGSLLQLIAGATLTHGTGLAAAVAGGLSSAIALWLEVVAATLVVGAAGSVAMVWTSARHALPRQAPRH